jgi:hypothetical protein
LFPVFFNCLIIFIIFCPSLFFPSIAFLKLRARPCRVPVNKGACVRACVCVWPHICVCCVNKESRERRFGLPKLYYFTPILVWVYFPHVERMPFYLSMKLKWAVFSFLETAHCVRLDVH